MQNWIQINVALLQNSIGKQKEKGRNDKEKETKENEIQIKVKHINGIQNYIKKIKLCFSLIQNLVAFS